MLEKEGKNIDACTIGIPDHMHATVALACMQRGKHVYVEKPLTRTPWEARLLKDAAVKYKVTTQMATRDTRTKASAQRLRSCGPARLAMWPRCMFRRRRALTRPAYR